MEEGNRVKKGLGAEPFICLSVLCLLFGGVGSKMGIVNMVSTIMATAFDLLINTAFYIMAIAVVTGGIASLLMEFGVIAVVNKILSPLIRPIYGLPGASIVGIITTFFSDNPAILTLAEDKNFRKYFKKYQLPALTNIGTAFGMGLIIIVFMMSIENNTGENMVIAAIVGLFGAIAGSIVSTRLMLRKTHRLYGEENLPDVEYCDSTKALDERVISDGGIGERTITALMEGGKNGVNVGMTIIPGIVIICTFVILLTNGPGEGGSYTGGAYEGVGLLPYLAEKIEPILKPLFGFTSPECISVPITSLGAAAAAIGLVPGLVEKGLATGCDIAVFTAMCMCWSGYLSTHIAMMDGLNFRNLSSRAIFSHTMGGICAGIFAHWAYYGLMHLF